MKTVRFWYKDKQTEQWNKSDLSRQIYVHTGGTWNPVRHYKSVEKNGLLRGGTRKTVYHMEENKTRTYLMPHSKVDSSWIIDLNAKGKTKSERIIVIWGRKDCESIHHTAKKGWSQYIKIKNRWNVPPANTSSVPRTMRPSRWTQQRLTRSQAGLMASLKHSWSVEAIRRMGESDDYILPLIKADGIFSKNFWLERIVMWNICHK